MMKRWKKGLLWSLLACGITFILVDQLAHCYQLIIASAILVLGLVITFWPYVFKTSMATTPTATAPCPTPAPAPKTADKKKAVPGDGGWFSIIFGFATIFGGLYLLFFQFAPWVNRTYESVMTSLPDHPPYISGVLPIGHNASNPATIPAPKKPNPNLFYKVLQPGIVYDVFPLENKQIWEWNYLQSNLAYRVRATGREPFSVLAENAIRSQEWAAQYAGTLQIKTIQPGNRVRLIRYNRFDM